MNEPPARTDNPVSRPQNDESSMNLPTSREVTGQSRVKFSRGMDAFRADPRMKSSFLAAFLSLVPGLGQIYIGYYKRGFINPIVVGGLISILVASGDFERVPFYFPICIFFLIFFWLYNIIDAWRRALMYNLSLEGVENIPLPDDMSNTGIGGSLFGGILILAVSFATLLYTKFEMPIEYLEQWWPVAPMAFGGYLVYRHFEEKKLIQ